MLRFLRLTLAVLAAIVSFPFAHVLAEETAGTIAGELIVDPTGQASYTIPLEVPPGIAGMQPELSLSYHSLAGNGPLGVGWRIKGFSSITRCRATIAQDGAVGGIVYGNSDRFCYEGQRLVAVNDTAYGAENSEYRKEINDFSRIFARKVVPGNGPSHFEVQTQSGLTMIYGTSSDSAIRKDGQAGGFLEWKLRELYDRHGNSVTFN